MSDLHNIPIDYQVPEGDVLVIAGDICSEGIKQEVEEFDEFLALQPHAAKIVVAGNHDWPFESVSPYDSAKLLKHAIYLEDNGVEIFGLKFWGSPWQPEFFNWAFNLPRGSYTLAEVWEKIPTDTDVLITHSPPFGMLDYVNGCNAGCEHLSRELIRIKPKLHVFGHIHQEYGLRQKDGTIYVNACVRDEKYRLVNPPIVVDL